MPCTIRGVLKDLGIVGNDMKLNNDTMQDYTYRIMDFFATVLTLPKPLIGLKCHAFLAVRGDKNFFGSWLDAVVVVAHGASMLLLVELSYLNFDFFVDVVFL
jgi:hypothetical protein